MNTIINIIKYFGKFPDRQGVLNNFHSSKDPIDGYDELKAEIEGFPAALLPEIEEYVFSTTEQVISEKLRNMKGYFLLLEYGAIAGNLGQAGGRSYAINLAITVGHTQNKKNTDIMAESLRMDKCLELLMAIYDEMEEDNYDFCGQTKYLDGQINFAPVEPSLLYNNMGWVLSFKKNETMK